jgi:hypothetical protein
MGIKSLTPILLVGFAMCLAALALVFIKVPDSSSRDVAQSMDSQRKPLSQATYLSDFDFSQPRRPTPSAISTEDITEDPEQPWQRAITDLLQADDENAVVAAKLATLLPSLPIEGQTEAAQHIVNLLDDEKYTLASGLLLNTSLHPEVLGVIYSDVSDRPNFLKLPILSKLALQFGHPLQSQSRESLLSVLGLDPTAQPLAWDAAIRELLTKEAAEQALDNEAN